MRHSLLRHHVQKKILFKRSMYRKDIEQMCLISCCFFKKQTGKVNKQGYEKKIVQNLLLMSATRRREC